MQKNSEVRIQSPQYSIYLEDTILYCILGYFFKTSFIWQTKEMQPVASIHGKVFGSEPNTDHYKMFLYS